MQCHHIFSEGSSCLSSQPKEEGKGILGCFIGGIQQCNVTISFIGGIQQCNVTISSQKLLLFFFSGKQTKMMSWCHLQVH